MTWGKLFGMDAPAVRAIELPLRLPRVRGTRFGCYECEPGIERELRVILGLPENDAREAQHERG